MKLFKIISIVLFLSLLTLMSFKEVKAQYVGSTCTSNDDCNYDGGICVADYDESGQSTGKGICASEELLAQATGVSNGQLLAQGSTAAFGTDLVDTVKNNWSKVTKFILDKEQSSSELTASTYAQYLSRALTNSINGMLLSESSETGLAYDDGAVIEIASLTDSMIWNQPASSVEYIADIGRNAGFTSEAYAQDGSGWSALSPVLSIWKAFRNIAYFGFVIVFVVIGFMIMFQSKIGGQAIVTIQMALPQITITLLLITFSYAIVALMIDLIYVLIYFVVGIFATFGILNNGAEAINILMSNSIFGLIWQHIIGPSEVSGSAASAINAIVESMFTQMVGNAAGNILGAISGVLGFLIIAVWILFSVFKVFFMLLKAYVSIVFGIIFAPIILMANAIPGSTAAVGWFKSILANVLVFPAVAILILIGVALTNGNNHNSNNQFNVASGIGYDPGQVQDVALPFIALNTSGIIAIVGLGFVIMLPNLLEVVYKALGVEPGLQGAFTDSATGVLGGVMSVPKAAGTAAIGMGGSIAVNEFFRRRDAREGQEKITDAKPLASDPNPTKKDDGFNAHRQGGRAIG